jgi:hypothetical protein
VKGTAWVPYRIVCYLKIIACYKRDGMNLEIPSNSRRVLGAEMYSIVLNSVRYQIGNDIRTLVKKSKM